MKKIVIMMMFIMTMFGTEAFANGRTASENIVREYCEYEGMMLIDYEGVTEDRYFKYTAYDWESGRKLICMTNAEYAINMVHNDFYGIPKK